MGYNESNHIRSNVTVTKYSLYIDRIFLDIKQGDFILIQQHFISDVFFLNLFICLFTLFETLWYLDVG